MNMHEAGRDARALMALHGLTGWTFGWNARKRAAGICNFRTMRIELSEPYVLLNGPDEVRDTVLHEIAHALAGHSAGHGWGWKAIARRIGASGERCASAKAVRVPHLYEARCTTCGKVCATYHRLPRVLGRKVSGCHRVSLELMHAS